MSSEVATPGCGAKSRSRPGAASGTNEVRASAGATAATTPTPIQSSFKNARRSIEASRNFAEIPSSKLEPVAKVPRELLSLLRGIGEASNLAPEMNRRVRRSPLACGIVAFQLIDYCAVRAGTSWTLVIGGGFHLPVSASDFGA